MGQHVSRFLRFLEQAFAHRVSEDYSSHALNNIVSNKHKKAIKVSAERLKSKVRRRRRWVIWLRDGGILLLILLAVFTWQTRNLLSNGESVAEDSSVLLSLDGDKLIMQPDGEKPTVVYFFAPWCTICKASIGNLQYVDTSRFHVLRIALDYTSVEQVRQFVDDAAIEAPVYLGNAGLQARFKITGYPTYYLLSKDYAVTDKAMGYSSAAGLKVRTWLAD